MIFEHPGALITIIQNQIHNTIIEITGIYRTSYLLFMSTFQTEIWVRVHIFRINTCTKTVFIVFL